MEGNFARISDLLDLSFDFDEIQQPFSIILKKIGLKSIEVKFIEDEPNIVINPIIENSIEDIYEFTNAQVENFDDEIIDVEGFVEDAEIDAEVNIEDTTHYKYEISLHSEILSEFEIDLLGLENIKFVFNPQGIIIEVKFRDYEFERLVITLGLILRISSEYLHPVNEVNGPDGRTIYEKDQTKEYVDIEIGGSRISLDKNMKIDINSEIEIGLPYSMIGDSGVIIYADNIKLDLSGETSPEEVLEAGYEAGFKGIYIDIAQLIIPDLSTQEGIPLTLSLENGIIGSGGFSGAVSAEWDVVLNNERTEFDTDGCGILCSLFTDDFQIALKKASIIFERNNPIEFTLEGALKLPYFDSIVEVELSLGDGGEFLVGLKGMGSDGLLKLSKEELFDLTVNGFQFRRSADEMALTISGEMEITHPDAKKYIPIIDLENFSLRKLKGSDWDFEFDTISLDINRSYDLNGFRLDLNKIGLAKIENEPHLILSGGVKLLEGLDAGAWLKGLRIPLSTQGSFGLDGIAIMIVSPKSFEFKGEIEHYREGDTSIFRGGIALNIIPVEMGIESQIMIGRKRDYAFAYIYAKVNFFAPGYQLGPPPLYARSVDGLVGINVTLSAEETHEYFPLFDKPPRGITHASKWRDEPGQYAIGLGVRIATAKDRLFSMNALLAILFPDLKLLIEGKAFVLEKPSIGKEPPFRSLMVLQKDPFAAMFTVAAEYEFINGIIKVSGTMEAYFGPDPENSSKNTWYFALGQAKPYFPVDKPLKAEVLQVFEAAAYLIVMPNLWVTGAMITLLKKYDFSIASVKFEAFIKGGMELRWDPEQVKGELSLSGSVGFKIFRKGFDVTMRAAAIAMAKDLYIYALLEFGVSFKLFWKEVKFEASIPFEWKKRIKPPIPEMLEKIVLLHAVSDKSWELDILDNQITDPEEIKNVTDAEPDSIPLISFRFPIRDETNLPFGQNGVDVPDHISGDYTFKTRLPEGGIKMWRCGLLNGEPVLDADGNIIWQEFINPIPVSDDDSETESGGPLTVDNVENKVAVSTSSLGGILAPVLYGAWLKDEDPDGIPYSTYLQLFSKTPFAYDRNKVKSRDFVRMVLAEEPVQVAGEMSGASDSSSMSACNGSDNTNFFAAASLPAYKLLPIFKKETRSMKNEKVDLLTERLSIEYPALDLNSDMIEKRSLNFLRDDLKEYSRSQILNVDMLSFSATGGFQIKDDIANSGELRFLSIGGNKKQPNYLLVNFTKPVKKVSINFICESDKENSRVLEYYSAYARLNPEKGPFNYENCTIVSLKKTLSSDRLTTEIESGNGKSAEKFDLLQLKITDEIKILSLEYEVDNSEYLKKRMRQLHAYTDITWRQRQDPSAARPGARALTMEPGTADNPGGPVSLLSEERDFLLINNAINQHVGFARLTNEGIMTAGYAYKLLVKSEVERNNDGCVSKSQYAYFKIEDKPATLSPYVLRTFPNASGYPYYRARELFVRFLKNYMSNLLRNPFLVLAEQNKLVWKLFKDGGENIIDYHPGDTLQNEDLADFYNSNSLDQSGWRWGTAPDHMLTTEEAIWMNTYNNEVEAEQQLTAEMALGDEIIWISPANHIMLRAAFSEDNNFQEIWDDGTPGDSSRWQVQSPGGLLYHNFPGELNNESGIPEESIELMRNSLYLSTDTFCTDYILSVWLKCVGDGGQTGLVFSQIPDNSDRFMIYVDFENKRIELQRRYLENDTEIVEKYASKEYFLPENRWIRLFLTVKSTNDSTTIALKQGNNPVFSSTVNTIINSGKAGFYASSDYTGYYDNLELHSISQLEKLPQAGLDHQMVFLDKEFYSYNFKASLYLDFFDHMNSWDRMIWVAQSNSEGIDSDQVVLWYNAKSELLNSMRNKMQDEDNQILNRLQSIEVEGAGSTDIENTNILLKNARFEVDKHFDLIAGKLGFDLSLDVKNIEITVSKDGYAMFIQSPEPIDWTRISASPISDVSSGTSFNTTILYSSDMTKTILFIEENSSDGYKTFISPEDTENITYNWSLFLDREASFNPYHHLNWLKPWLSARNESYNFTFEIDSDIL